MYISGKNINQCSRALSERHLLLHFIFPSDKLASIVYTKDSDEFLKVSLQCSTSNNTIKLSKNGSFCEHRCVPSTNL